MDPHRLRIRKAAFALLAPILLTAVPWSTGALSSHAQEEPKLSEVEMDTRANRKVKSAAEALIEAHRLFHRYRRGGFAQPKKRIETLVETLIELRGQIERMKHIGDTGVTIAEARERELMSESTEILQWIGREQRHDTSLERILNDTVLSYRDVIEAHADVRIFSDIKQLVTRAELIIRDPLKVATTKPKPLRIRVLFLSDGTQIRAKSWMEFGDKIHFITLDGKRKVLPRSEVTKSENQVLLPDADS